MFKIFDEVTTELVKESFEFYSRISDDIKVRITDLPAVEKIRDLRYGGVKNMGICAVIAHNVRRLPKSTNSHALVYTTATSM